MISALKSELHTFYSKIFVWIMTLLLLLPICWFMGNSYRNIYYSMESELSYIYDAQQAIQEMDIEYDLSEEYDILLDMVSVVTPENAINNTMMVFIGIGTIVMPILFALYIGSEYTNNQIELKMVHYKLVRVIAAKIIVLSTYLISITILLAVVGQYIADYHWNVYSETIGAVNSYIKLPYLDINYRLILITVVMLVFYSFISFFVAMFAKNSVVGIVSSVVIVYGESYILNSSMPKWIFYNWLNENTVTYDSSFVEFAMPNKVAPHGPVLSILIMSIYFVILFGGIFTISKRKS